MPVAMSGTQHPKHVFFLNIETGEILLGLFKLVLPFPASALGLAVLPWRSGISRKLAHTVVGTHFSKVPLELRTWVAYQYFGKSKNPCPCVHECVPAVFWSLPVVISDNLNLLVGSSPTDNIHPVFLYSMHILHFCEIQTNNVVEAV